MKTAESAPNDVGEATEVTKGIPERSLAVAKDYPETIDLSDQTFGEDTPVAKGLVPLVENKVRGT